MRTAVRATAAAVLAATLAAATACAAGPEGGAPAGAVAPESPAPASPAPASPAVASPASASLASVPATLSFTGKTLDGTAFNAATLAGRPVVLWFWAPWCATCASQAWTVAEIAPTGVWDSPR